MPIEFSCETCGKSFTRPPSALKYDPPRFCCPKCFYKWLKGSERAKRIDTTCGHCGKPMRVLESRYNDGRGRFCSQACMIAERPPSRSVEKVKRICQHCSDEFEIYPSWLKNDGGKFCSKACAYAGREMPQRTEHVECICEHCGKAFHVMPHVVSRPNRGRFCSAQCRGAATAAMIGRISPTSIEQLLIDELARRHIPFCFQYPLGKYVLDFAFPIHQLAIEADGIYWHSLENVQEKDARKDQDLADLGWTILHFDGDQIRESPATCVDQILEHL